MMYIHIWWIGIIVSLLAVWVVLQWRMSKGSQPLDYDDAGWFFLFCLIWPITAFCMAVIGMIAGFAELFTRQILFKPSPAKQKCKMKNSVDTWTDNPIR